VKDTWYGDDRDLVKWGTLVHLAHREKIRQVVQVAFLRKGERPPLKTSQGEVAIDDEVWAHFRDVESVERLGPRTGLHINVISQSFDPAHRQDYMSQVVDCLRNIRENKVVLLDPDTGIAPQTARPEHVRADEIRHVWEALVEGDWLVLYQHGFRRPDWRSLRRQQFEEASCTEEVEVFESRRIANDVVFFAARKS